MLLPFPPRHHPRPRLPRILAVHPAGGMIRLLREMFIFHRCAVLIEQSSSVAMARHRLSRLRERPRLLIIGVGLHHQEGFGLLRHVRSDHRLAAMPVVVLAQCPQLQDERRALAIGADFYLEHPAGIEDFSPLVARCRELLALAEERDNDEAQSAG